MPRRHPASHEGHACPWPQALGTGLLLVALLGGCGGGSNPVTSEGAGTPAPPTPVTPGTDPKATQSGQVAIGDGSRTQSFVPTTQGSSRNFGISLVGSKGLYEFKGTLDGVSSSTTLGVEFWQHSSTAPDVVTLTTASGTYTCGGLTRRACNGLSTTVADDRRSLSFRFDGVVVQASGQVASRTLTGLATAQFPAALPYIVPSDLPTARTASLTLDGAALNAVQASTASLHAMLPSASAREFTLSATQLTLSELPWGTANLGSEPQSFLCVPPNQSGACSGLTLEQTPDAATYRFASVSLKETLDGVVLAGRRVLNGTLMLPYPQASVNQVGTSHTLQCSGDACAGSNFIASGAGHVRQTLAVEQRSGGSANNGMTSIGYTYDVFNPADRMLTVLPGTGDGGFSCVASATQATGDCSGVRVEADGMTVVLDQVVVRDLAGNQRRITGSFKVGGR